MSSKKILMLHGFTQSGPVFGATSVSLRKALMALGYELVFATVPLLLDHDIIPFGTPDSDDEESDVPPPSWIPGTEDFEFEYVYEHIKQLTESEGPFEGIIGLSRSSALNPTLGSDLLSTFAQDLQWSISLREKVIKIREELVYTMGAPQFQTFRNYNSELEEEQDLFYYNVSAREEVVIAKYGQFVPQSAGFVQKISNWIISATVDI